MRPLLRAALAATLLATLALALWPQDEAVVVPVVAAARRPAAAPVAPGLAAGADAAVRTTVAAAAVPADGAIAAAPTPVLPTRAADWPAPPAAALAAWQGQAAAPLPSPAAASRQAALQAAAAAAVPAAPVFPYRWIGQLDDGGAPQLLLASAQRSVGVRLGATLDARWRLVRHASGQLLAQALPDGEAVPVPGAPLLAPDPALPTWPR